MKRLLPIPGTFLKKGLKRYFIFYSFDDKCYFSVTADRSNVKKATPYRVAHPENTHVLYDFRFASFKVKGSHAHEATDRLLTFIYSKEKQGYKPWSPTQIELNWMTVQIHFWQERTDTGESCNNPAPLISTECEEYGTNKHACQTDWVRQGTNQACEPYSDGDCMPKCRFIMGDGTKMHCETLPADLQSRAKFAQFADQSNVNQDVQTQVDNLLDALPDETLLQQLPTTLRQQLSPETLDKYLNLNAAARAEILALVKDDGDFVSDDEEEEEEDEEDFDWSTAI